MEKLINNKDCCQERAISDNLSIPGDNMRLCRWLMSSAAVIGSGHESKNLPCQDYTAGRQSNGVVAAALSDGAGSAKRSEVGAELCVETVLDFLCDAFDEIADCDRLETARQVLRVVHAKLQSTAKLLYLDIKDLASTLLFVAIKDGRFIAGHLGDGVIGCERNSSVEVLSHPVRGEHANETIFTTSSRAVENFKIFKGFSEGISSFVLMSDGSAESLYLRRNGSLAPAIGTFWTWLDSNPESVVIRALRQNIKDLLREPTTDDCSVLLLRQVNMTMKEFGNKSTAFQQEFFKMKNSKGLNYRLKVLKTLFANPRSSRAEIVAATGFAPTTVKNHLRSLRDLLGIKVLL